MRFAMEFWLGHKDFRLLGTGRPPLSPHCFALCVGVAVFARVARNFNIFAIVYAFISLIALGDHAFVFNLAHIVHLKQYGLLDTRDSWFESDVGPNWSKLRHKYVTYSCMSHTLLKSTGGYLKGDRRCLIRVRFAVRRRQHFSRFPQPLRLFRPFFRLRVAAVGIGAGIVGVRFNPVSPLFQFLFGLHQLFQLFLFVVHLLEVKVFVIFRRRFEFALLVLEPLNKIFLHQTVYTVTIYTVTYIITTTFVCGFL